MPFGAHETMEVHEILNEKMNLIHHFSLYSQMTQNPQLKQMIDRHLQTAIQSYDQLVAYTHDYSAGRNVPPASPMPRVDPQQIQYGLRNPAMEVPQTQLRGTLNDQQIMQAMLCAHKSSATNHMKASLECADSNVRQMLINGSVSCSNQAYEVFLMMNGQGLYQVPTMQDHTAKTYLHRYQPVHQSMQQSSTMMPPPSAQMQSGQMPPQ